MPLLVLARSAPVVLPLIVAVPPLTTTSGMPLSTACKRPVVVVPPISVEPATIAGGMFELRPMSWNSTSSPRFWKNPLSAATKAPTKPPVAV